MRDDVRIVIIHWRVFGSDWNDVENPSRILFFLIFLKSTSHV